MASDAQQGYGFDRAEAYQRSQARKAKRRRRAPAPVVHDVKSNADRGRAEAYKRTPAYKRDVQQVYDQAPPKQKTRLQQAAAKSRTVEAKAIRERADQRARGLQDTKSDAEFAKAQRYKSTQGYARQVSDVRRQAQAKVLGKRSMTQRLVDGVKGDSQYSPDGAALRYRPAGKDIPRVGIVRPGGHGKSADDREFSAFLKNGTRPIRTKGQGLTEVATAAPVLKVLDQTTRPVHAVAAGTKAGIEGKNIPKAALAGLKLEDKTLFSDVLKSAGVKNKAVAGTVGFAGDVALDPLTYLTLGTGSVAKKAMVKAAKDAEAKALKAGMTAERAKALGQVAAKRAAKGKPTNSGLDIRVAGRSVPGVVRSTSAVKRAPRKAAQVTRVDRTRAGQAVGRGQQKVRDTARDIASDVNSAVTPAGVDRAAYQAARRVARTARSETARGTYKASERALAYKAAIGTKNYAAVIDAVETGRINALPAELRKPARLLAQDFGRMRKAERAVGINTPKRSNYVPHINLDYVNAEGGKGAKISGGSRSLKPDYGKARQIEGTVAEKNVAGNYSADVAQMVATRGAKSAADVAKAKLNRSMIEAGRRPKVGESLELKPDESLYNVKGSDLRKLDPKADRPEIEKLLSTGTAGRGGQYVVLSDRVIARTHGEGGQSGRLSTLGRTVDRTQGVWKGLATQANPGFHVRNLAGEAQNAYLAEGPLRLAKNTVVAGRALRELGRSEKALRSLDATPEGGKYAAFIRGAEQVGAIRSGQIGRELHDLIDGAARKKVVTPTDWGQLGKALTKGQRGLKNMEDLFRLATYKGGLDRGLSPDQAVARASKYHFDYGELTRIERQYLRRALPFWTFSARNIPLQVQTLMTSPGKFAQFQKMREEFAKAFGFEDDWEEKNLTRYEQGATPIPVKWKGKEFTLSLGSTGLPLSDLTVVPVGSSGEVRDEWTDRAASLLSPIIKSPLEYGLNYSFFFRNQLERDTGPYVAAPAWISALPDKVKKDLGVVDDYIYDRNTGKKTAGWPAKIDYLTGQLPGPLAQPFRLGKKSSSQDLGDKTLAYTTGLQVRQPDRAKARSGQLYEELKKVDKRLAGMRQRGITADKPSPLYVTLLGKRKGLNRELDQIQLGQKQAATGASAPKVDRETQLLLNEARQNAPAAMSDRELELLRREARLLTR